MGRQAFTKNFARRVAAQFGRRTTPLIVGMATTATVGAGVVFAYEKPCPDRKSVV